MPYVEVNITKGASAEQKAELIDGITDLMVRVLNKILFDANIDQ